MEEISVADRIRLVMEERKLTVEAFAALLGEKPQRVKDVLRGKQRVPEDMLVALANAHVDVAYILTGVPLKAHRRLGAINQASLLLQQAGAPKEVGKSLMPALFELLSADVVLEVDEGQLLDNYRACAPADREQIMKLAQRLVPAEPKTKRKSK